MMMMNRAASVATSAVRRVVGANQELARADVVPVARRQRRDFVPATQSAVLAGRQQSHQKEGRNSRPLFALQQQQQTHCIITLAGDNDDDDNEDVKKHRDQRLLMLRNNNNNNHHYPANHLRSPPPSLQLLSSQQPIIMRRQQHSYHTTAHSDRGAVAIVLGLGALSATSYAAASAVSAYREWQEASRPTPEELAAAAAAAAEAEQQQAESADAAPGDNDDDDKGAKQQEPPKADSDGTSRAKNVFSEWFGVGVGAKYYEGGFEEIMTRREAALILGVRESSPPSRIKDAHRKLLILNHPDAGGSTYVALKINEAKELLLKGRRDRNEK